MKEKPILRVLQPRQLEDDEKKGLMYLCLTLSRDMTNFR